MSAHSVFDPRTGIFVRRTDLLALLLAFEHLATMPERCEGKTEILRTLATLGVLDTYSAIKSACTSDVY